MSSADESEDLTQQCEEIEALSAIYGDDFLVVDEASRLYEVRVSNESDTWWSGTLQVLLPSQYPSKVPPVFEVHSAWMSDSEMFEITDKLHSIYRENRGEIVLYLWVEKLREFIDNKVAEFIANEQLEKEEKQKGLAFEDAGNLEHHTDYNTSNEVIDDTSNFHLHQITSIPKLSSDETSCPEISHGVPFTDRKSTFQAHIAQINTVDQVKLVIDELKLNRKIANAGHNVMAYRIFCKERKSLVQDCDDDGELHAGSRLLHLLQILEVKDVVVMVTRWYGGILLGPDRFKHYNNSARDLLKAAGFIAAENKEGSDHSPAKPRNHKLLTKMRKHR